MCYNYSTCHIACVEAKQQISAMLVGPLQIHNDKTEAMCLVRTEARIPASLCASCSLAISVELGRACTQGVAYLVLQLLYVDVL